MAEAVSTPDGRQLACVEVGDQDGPLLLHNQGGRHFVGIGAGEEIFAVAAKELGAS